MESPKSCLEKLALGGPEDNQTFLRGATPEGKSDYSMYSKPQNVNIGFLDSRLGPTLSCLVAEKR